MKTQQFHCRVANRTGSLVVPLCILLCTQHMCVYYDVYPAVFLSVFILLCTGRYCMCILMYLRVSPAT